MKRVTAVFFVDVLGDVGKISPLIDSNLEGGKLMARQARGEVVDPTRVQIFHCMQRCVRRAFLCGSDPLTGRSFDHRRQWIRDRLEFLASVFAIDCLTYTVMDNHLHLVLRTRPDVVESWSDAEVARRWLRLFPVRRNRDGSEVEPSQSEIDTIVESTRGARGTASTAERLELVDEVPVGDHRAEGPTAKTKSQATSGKLDFVPRPYSMRQPSWHAPPMLI